MRLFFIALIPLFVFFSLAGSISDTRLYEGGPTYPDHLDGPFTGGFGEQTCHSCHFDNEINDAGGDLSLKGINERYQPGERHELVVMLEDERLEKGGFQMTARFEDGSQAGKFSWKSERLDLTPTTGDTLQYVQHSVNGTNPTGEHKITWALSWKAPEAGSGPVVFNIAANAGNDDDSAFGDWIYVKELVVESKH